MGITAGKSPRVVAAACIYIASMISGYNVMLAELSKASKATDNGIKTRARDMMKKLGIKAET
jgi:transcription initiation factor TFIIIB Brf1 subunit/transcription initiation factor TFIIB